MTDKEAENLLAQLEQHYRQPVLPLGRFCEAITLWFRCIEENNTDAELKEGGYHGRKYFEALRRIETDIRKSNLLGRLLYAKEQFRTKKCPIHKGHWSGQAMFFQPCPHKCDGTGWLRARPQDGGFTGNVSIHLAREVDGKLQIKDPHTGEWKAPPEDK